MKTVVKPSLVLGISVLEYLSTYIESIERKRCQLDGKNLLHE